MESWTDIWQRGQEARGDPVDAKVFIQQDLGEPYEPKNDTPDWEKLLGARKPWKRGVVPWPASVLTGFIDVQGNRFEWGLWAWGEGFQGWLVDRGVIAHDYTEDQAWAAIDALTSRRWPTAGGGELDVMHWGIDTGAFTQILYDRVSGRHALLATKGDNRPSATPLKKGRADLRDPRSGRPIAGRRLNLAFIGNFDLKLSVYEGLRNLVAGPDQSGLWSPGTLHLPDWIGEDDLRQLTAEVLIDPREYEAGAANKRRGALVKTGERREWRKKPRQANEALDIVVGARALAWGEGAGQLTRFGMARAGGQGAWGDRAADIVHRAAGCARNAGEGSPPATQRDEIDQVVAAAAKLKAAAEAGGESEKENLVADQNESLTDFEEGARRALEWLGRSEDAAELAQIIGEMPPKLGDMETAFLIAIGRAALAGHKAAPQTEDEAKARPATLPPPADSPPAPWIDVDEFRRRQRAHEQAARYEELAGRNANAFVEMHHAFAPNRPKGADWS